MASSTSLSIPIISIPIYYGQHALIAQYPHGHALTVANKGDFKKHDNRNPKGSQHAANLKKRLNAKELAAFERGESCHRNHLENMPFFIATVFAGLLAEQKAGEGAVGLDAFCLGFLTIRVLYTANYITTESMNWSYLRSILYFLGVIWSSVTLYKSAVVIGA